MSSYTASGAPPAQAHPGAVITRLTDAIRRLLAPPAEPEPLRADPVEVEEYVIDRLYGERSGTVESAVPSVLE